MLCLVASLYNFSLRDNKVFLYLCLYLYPYLYGIRQQTPSRLLQAVSQVIGIEMCKEAVEDAKVNADLNGECMITCECGMVVSVFQCAFTFLSSEEDCW